VNAEGIEVLKTHLVVDEGVKLHAYQDSLGFWTIGVGRLIDARRGGGISYAEALDLLDNDIEKHWRELVERLPWVLTLDVVRQVALANLVFNLGVDGLAKFVNTLAAVKRGDWSSAANGLRNSRWYTQVQRSRSERIIYMVLKGEVPHA
jgi:lysozyme